MADGEKRFIDFDLEDINSEGGIERYIYIMLVAVFILVVSVIGYLGLVALTPFEPYQAQSYEPTDTYVCPSERIDVYAYRTVDQSYEIERIEISGYWYSEEEGLVGDVSGSIDPTVQTNPVRSVAFRNAPDIEGTWYPRTTVEVDGSVYGWDQTQKSSFTGETPVVVEDGEGC